MTEVLEGLHRQFARFQIIEEVHPTPEVHDLIEQAYLIGIAFAQYAIRYYLRGSLGEQLTALPAKARVGLLAILTLAQGGYGV
jgi:hypothetical protein